MGWPIIVAQSEHRGHSTSDTRDWTPEDRDLRRLKRTLESECQGDEAAAANKPATETVLIGIESTKGGQERDD